MELSIKQKNMVTEDTEKPVEDIITIRARKREQQEKEQKSFVKKMIGIYIAIFLLFFVLVGPLTENGIGGGGSSSVSSTFASMLTVLGVGENTKNIGSEEPPIPKKDVKSVYDETLPLKNTNGLCEVTIDNKANDMPVYVRIWDVSKQEPVRALYIQEGDYFTVDNLAPGIYEVRYKELYENHVPAYSSKSAPIELAQSGKGKDISYTAKELKLNRRGVAVEGMQQINSSEV